MLDLFKFHLFSNVYAYIVLELIYLWNKNAVFERLFC